MSIDYKEKYLKYKKKYLDIKKNNLEQEGGAKRTLKNFIDKEDIILANSVGTTNLMNKFLLAPEVNFIYDKCSKNKNYKNQCSKDNINDLITYIINIEQTYGNFDHEIKNLIKFSKLTKDFVMDIIKHHKSYIKDNLSEDN
tara:strand:- start:2380 stop:2802 length:423 start_codon:yes stop_codon:yes gene_type:complete